jgi:hypothetical protein
VRLSRSSLCGILLESGEEDLAVLIASAGLPEILDTGSDAPVLAALGLSEEDLQALLPAVSGTPARGGSTGPEEMDRLSQTISDRWAHLVSMWTVSANGNGATNDHDDQRRPRSTAASE